MTERYHAILAAPPEFWPAPSLLGQIQESWIGSKLLRADPRLLDRPGASWIESKGLRSDLRSLDPI